MGQSCDSYPYHLHESVGEVDVEVLPRRLSTPVRDPWHCWWSSTHGWCRCCYLWNSQILGTILVPSEEPGWSASRDPSGTGPSRHQSSRMWGACCSLPSSQRACGLHCYRTTSEMRGLSSGIQIRWFSTKWGCSKHTYKAFKTIISLKIKLLHFF
jgi:hypothetical protein